MSYVDPRPVSEAEMLEAIPLLPENFRQALAKGPQPGHDLCQVCTVFSQLLLAIHVDPDVYDETHPHWVVVDYHDEPHRWPGRKKKHANRAACYRRCLEVYRACGWTG